MSRDYETERKEAGSTDAQIHAEIAKRVYPDIKIGSNHCKPICELWEGGDGNWSNRDFNLLETDNNGNPTQQAKASALDVLVSLQKAGWLGDMDYFGKIGYGVYVYSAPYTNPGEYRENINPCAAIYEAASEVIENE